MPTPTDVVHARAENTVTITWDDATQSVYPAGYLRGWCPCASCQGHRPGVRCQGAPETVEIEGLFEMGAYALAVRFSDGHDTGIYTWEWLFKLAPQSEPAGYKVGAYLGGKFVE